MDGWMNEWMNEWIGILCWDTVRYCLRRCDLSLYVGIATTMMIDDDD